MTCTRTQEVLGQDYNQAKEIVSANKTKLPLDKAMELLKGIDQIYSCKPNKVIHLDLKKQNPSKEEIAATILGPTGNLRAPAIKAGKKLIVGFNKDLLKELTS
ncbi:MAG: ArsC family (seleno)protein [Candidatus Melainabacteria bacterium]|nr:ArsC family (seleno)protein [Candidatus Melainabacteria bacterium]